MTDQPVTTDEVTNRECPDDHDHIGEWVERQGNLRPHLVESRIRGSAVTRCGRRMRLVDTKNKELRFVKAKPDSDVCWLCLQPKK